MSKIREIIEKYANAEYSRDDYMTQSCIIWEDFDKLEGELEEYVKEECCDSYSEGYADGEPRE